MPLSTFEKHLKKDCSVSFHMPGHKKNFGLFKYLKRINGMLDTTETLKTDNLYQSENIILNLKTRLADEYSAIKSYPLINGTTSGILSCIGLLNSNCKVLIDKFSHRCVYNGCEINKIDFDFIPKNENEIDYIALEKMTLNQNYSAVIATTPDYFGRLINLENLHLFCIKHNLFLFVDYAHGAHLHKLDIEKKYLQINSDISVTSLHKTLPTFTSTSLINVYSKSIDMKKLEKNLATYQTSSPSFPLIASIDCYLNLSKQFVSNQYKKIIANINRILTKTNGLECLKVYINDDPTRIIISTANTNITGQMLLKKLSDVGIECEMATFDSVICIASIGNTKYDFSKLYNALKQIDATLTKISPTQNTICNVAPKNHFPTYAVSHSFYELIDIDECLGKISKDYISIYPPNQPLCIPGQIIDDVFIHNFKIAKANSLNIFADYSDITNSKIAVLTDQFLTRGTKQIH